MRVALVQITQESNTFAPGVTGLDAFEERVLVEGRGVLEGDVGGFLTGILGEVGTWPASVELVPIIRAVAVAGPALAEDALAELVTRMERRLAAAGPVDGVVLIVHGACVTENGRSADGVIASAVRRLVGPSMPISAGLDHHAHLTHALVDSVNALVGHRSQPHDLVDTGARAARLLHQVLYEGVRPTITWRRLPMVTHQEQYATATGPMATWFARAHQYEQVPGVVSVSLFPMQPWLDVEGGGWSVIVITDHAGTTASASAGVDAASIADDLADTAWALRHDFLTPHSVPVDEAITAATQHPGLTLVSDLGDSVFGGALGDSTVLLDALLAADLPGPALVPVRAPTAVTSCTHQPVGANVEILVGTDGGPGRPVQVRGRLTARTDGVLHLPGFLHERADYGQCVLVETDQIKLMLTERRGISGNHPAAYTRLGIDVNQARIAVLKTAANIDGYADYRPHHIQVNTPGPTQSDIVTLPWKRLTRPIFPLDDIDH